MGNMSLVNTAENLKMHTDGSLQHFIEHSPVAIIIMNNQGHITYGNPAFHGLTKNKVTGRLPLSFSELLPADKKTEAEALLKKALTGEPPAETHTFEFALPQHTPIFVSAAFSRLEDGTLVVHLNDVTEAKDLDVRFAHSQKMQAVGQLAGGVAHDFNNLLTAMIGFCDLLLMRHPAGDQSFADIMQIKQNANRAANLVRQLLAFSRRQTLQPKVLDLTDVLAELSNLVRRLIGENIELKMVHSRDIKHVRADQGQLEQVLINLAVNARDAMTGGGVLTIRTSRCIIDRTHPLSRDLMAPAEEDSTIPDGEYVLVEVIDTGCGIPKPILQKIFEPFFSTKAVGSGTGLGLSTVYGIIKQTGGYVYVASKENEGTNFSLFFPGVSAQESTAAAAESESDTSDKNATADLTGKGTILLVEDETPVRIFAARALRNKGYTILEADCGETAIQLMQEHGKEVDVIVTDVIMPGMNGPTMIDKIIPQYPNVKVIFISGYAEDVFVNNYGAERSFNFLAKPFTLKQLASKIKDVTNAAGARATN
jgi:two-component system cell cycle sensor histidine kinase/response regulator CckA